MPQMAPLYWEILFFMFILSLLMMKIIIFHMPNIHNKKSSNNKLATSNITWKW
uniref:ATP synthase complex subunit 8 n=1 Tax=Augocoris gomesii TaxID=2080387 RepID=A0A2P1CLR3_9HEMI|nr:ATP synthase F0 subunit 8 [Augocoris gomesii]